ncbi:hypothetical protein NHQ30_000005 [Ciborinia camelliae]|nr:hypothetical protein NHQ30_000005 [Ciborinia camelliae]
MAVSLGDSYERFSIRLLTHPIHSGSSQQKYIEEYMEVGKKDPATGELTRFIISKDEVFGVEVTLQKGFNHGYYDGVMIKLSDVHSGVVFWQKKYPKSSSKEPSREDKTILIESIDYAVIEGKLRSNVRMNLVPLISENYFLMPGGNGTRRYPRMLEGLGIGVCKYKEAGEIQLTKEEFNSKLQEHASKRNEYADGRDSLDTLQRTLVHRNVYQKHNITHKLRLADGVAVPNEEIEKYLIPPTQTKKLFRYSDTQNFHYLWRGEKFFDTTAIAKTPIPAIRQSWDLLTPKERETAYGELSRYDFQQIWSHHYKTLGPKPKKAATDALKFELRQNLPEYWRSWGKLYAYEIPAAFKKLQERRRYLDKGEIPQDSELVGKSEKAAINLEKKPEKLEKLSGNIRTPSLKMGHAAARDAGLLALAPKPVAPLHGPEVAPQAGLDKTVQRTSSTTNETVQTMSSTTNGPANVQPTSGYAIASNFAAPATKKSKPRNPKRVCIECHAQFTNTRAFVYHCQAAHLRSSESMEQAAMECRNTGSTNTNTKVSQLDRESLDVATHGSPCPTATETSSTTDVLTTSSPLEKTAAGNPNDSLSKCPNSENRVDNRMTKCEPGSAKPYTPELSSSATTSPSTIKREPRFQAPKRPAEFMDLSRSKKRSPATKRSAEITSRIKVENNSNQLPVEQTINPSVSSLGNVKSEPSGSREHHPADTMDIDSSQSNLADPSDSASLSPDSSINTPLTDLTPPLPSSLLSTSSNIEPDTSQIASSSTAEPTNTTEMLPELLPLKSDPSSTLVPNPTTPTILPSVSKDIPVSGVSDVKPEGFQIPSNPAAQTMDVPTELPASPHLKSDVPSKCELSPSATTNKPTPTTPTLSQASTSTSTSKTGTTPSIPIIDLETWVPSMAFTRTYLSTTNTTESESNTLLKIETDNESISDKKLNLQGDLVDLSSELQSLEEEAFRKQTELEDAMRVAEARREMNGVRRRIEELRARGSFFDGSEGFNFFLVVELHSTAGGMRRFSLIISCAFDPDLVAHFLQKTAAGNPNDSLSKCPNSENRVDNRMTKCEPGSAKPYTPELSSSATTSPSTIKREPRFQAPKRPAEFMDLSRSKKRSPATKRSAEITSRIKVENNSNQLPVEQTINPSVSSLGNVKSEPSGSREHHPADTMDIDSSQSNLADPSDSASLSPDSSINTPLTDLTPPLPSSLLSTSSNIEPDTSQIASSSTAEPTNTTEMLPELLPLKSDPSSTLVPNPTTPTILPSVSKDIPVSGVSDVKPEGFQIPSNPAAQTMDVPTELPASPHLKSDVPSKCELSPSATTNKPTPTTPTLSQASTSTSTSKTGTTPSIPIIDLETWVPSMAFTRTYLSTTNTTESESNTLLKIETDNESISDKKLNLQGDLVDLSSELQSLEEEAFRKQTELEDAMRVAEARREMNGVRRRIEELRARGTFRRTTHSHSDSHSSSSEVHPTPLQPSDPHIKSNIAAITIWTIAAVGTIYTTCAIFENVNLKKETPKVVTIFTRDEEKTYDIRRKVHELRYPPGSYHPTKWPPIDQLFNPSERQRFWEKLMPSEKFTYTIMTMNIGIHALGSLTPGLWSQIFLHTPSTHRNFTLLTCIFGHGSLLHLGFNMYGFQSFMPTLGADTGFQSSIAHMTAFYLSTGIISSWAQALSAGLRPKVPPIPFLGASGSLFALLGSFTLKHPEAQFQIMFIPYDFSADGLLSALIVFDLFGVFGAYKSLRLGHAVRIS